MANFNEPIVDRESAIRFIEWCVLELGLGYHPDTPFEEYVMNESPCFDDCEAQRLNQLTESAYVYCDPYEVGMAQFAPLFADQPA